MYIEDPNQRIAKMKFLNGEGTPLNGYYDPMSDVSWTYGVYWTFRLANTPPPDTQMVLEQRVPEALRTFPFTVEVNPLP